MREKWKPIKNYESSYLVSDMGRIKSLYTGKFLTPSPDSDGYAVLSLTRSGIRRSYRWHKLVLSAFIDNKHNKSQINHINGNKLDNRLSNLEWVTPGENIKHAYKMGIKRQDGSHNNASKLEDDEVFEIRRRAITGENQSIIARDYGISQPTVSLIKLKRLWRKL